jgi:hypothetical protein
MRQVREVVGVRANAVEQRTAGREEGSKHGEASRVTVKGHVFTSVWRYLGLSWSRMAAPTSLYP